MFGVQFYPTPYDLVERMMGKIKKTPSMELICHRSEQDISGVQL